MSVRKRPAVTTTQTILVAALIVIVAGGGYWWYTAIRTPSEPSPSPAPSPGPAPTYFEYSRFGFTFECPEGMTFTAGSLLGGFDHANPISGDVQGVWEEGAKMVGVIWLPGEPQTPLEAVLDDLFETASEFLQFSSIGPLLNATGGEGEVVYQAFNCTDQGFKQTGVVGSWYSEVDKRIYALYNVELLGASSREEVEADFLRYLGSFEAEGWEAPTGVSEPYWPTEGWRYTAPDDVGLDPVRLSEMIKALNERRIGADSILVIRHGYIIYDVYFPPFDEGQRHIVYSCTKSVVSTLIGIALEEGYIESLDQRVLDFFPNRTVENLDAWKREMTLRDLLTMTAGFDARDSYLYNWEGLERMHGAEDAVQYVLDLPMAEKPGIRFEYTNGVSHLLSCIITEATNMTALEFARERLFAPLGITDSEWTTDPKGNNWGYSNLYLTPHDMAKIGYLFLKGGEWDGEQIVSREWVEEATSKKVHAGTLLDDYGFQWWISPRGYYSAIGYKGQFIHVVPDLDLVVVTTGHVEEDFNWIQSLLEAYVIPTVIS